MPSFVAPVIAANVDLFGRYPPIRGTEAFRATIAGWLNRRYGLAQAPVDPARMVLPLNGSREGLFFAALGARERAGREKPVILLPNPFYQAYAAGAEAAGAEIVLLEAGPEQRYFPDLSRLSKATLRRTIAVYIASPANPQGSVATIEDWTGAIAVARRHGFMIFADECYSEIYRATPPPGVLEAAQRIGEGYGGILTFHSLSKRSNLPGLRCGFVAGDPDFIEDWTRLRNMAAPQVPGPIQAVAVAAYGDEDHVVANRALYNRKFELAAEILGPRLGASVPEGGFFLWLEVGDGESAAVRLWAEAGVRTIPGGYLSMPGPDGRNPGDGYIRVAMVQDIETTAEALRRMAGVLGE